MNDIAIVGYDDLDYTESIGFTTVRQPLVEMGKADFKLAMLAIKELDMTQKTLNFKPVLVISTPV